MSVSLSSEFDIFALKPVQASVIETTEVSYKPIASVDQSDLEFLIPSDSDTYIELNIRLYVRGKLTKNDGTALGNTDFTAVTNNFLHSLFSQCSIALNSVTITQAAELYNYRSFFETILTYGIDAATSHLTKRSGTWMRVTYCPVTLQTPMRKTKVSSRDGTVSSRAKRSNSTVGSTATSVTYRYI